MKKSFFVCLASVSFVSANLALSPSIPLYPEEGLFLAHEASLSLKAGYMIDYLWKMDLKGKNGVRKSHLSRFSNLGQIGLCLFDLVQLDTFLGVEKNRLHYQQFGHFYRYQESSHFSFGFTAEGILNTWGKFQLGTSAFYQQVPEHRGTLYVDHVATPDSFRRYTWGVSLGFSYDYPPLAPYARLDFQKSKIHLTNLPDQSFHEKHPLGLAFGFVTDPLKGLYADFEIRVLQETGVRLLLGFRL